MNFEKKRDFSRFYLNYFYQIKKMFFFSIDSNHFETKLTFWDLIQVEIAYWKQLKVDKLKNETKNKLTGLFPKTCFCWNSPLQESQCFALLTDQGAEWLVIIISQQCKLAIMANSLSEKWIRKGKKMLDKVWGLRKN